jgi:hypothetical protein
LKPVKKCCCIKLIFTTKNDATQIAKTIVSLSEPLCEMRKPNFGHLVDQDMDDEGELLMSAGAKTYLGLDHEVDRPGSSCAASHLVASADRPGSGCCASYLDQDDAAMPFANERAGTIKYKTNPQVPVIKEPDPTILL